MKSAATGVLTLAVCAAVSFVWAVSLVKTSPYGMLDFKGIYYGTQCLLHGSDPYSVQDLQMYYLSHGGQQPTNAIERNNLLVVSLYINSPATFLVVAPFALLTWIPASVLWMTLVVLGLITSTFLIWTEARESSPFIALLFAAIVLVNCELPFAGGNTAGIVVSCTVVATWCLIHDRFPQLAILLMTTALLMKPHVAGPVWLCIALSGGSRMRRAFEIMAITIGFGILAILWVGHIAPHWLPEMESNLMTISGPGGINSPLPSSVGMQNADLIVDLQTVFALFVPDAGIANSLTYGICGILGAVWIVATVRSHDSKERVWFALATIVPLSLLVNYHRIHDAKLLLLTIPAISLQHGFPRVLRIGTTLVGGTLLFLTGEIPSAIWNAMVRGIPVWGFGISRRILLTPLVRPVPLLLLLLTLLFLRIQILSAPNMFGSKKIS